MDRRSFLPTLALLPIVTKQLIDKSVNPFEPLTKDNIIDYISYLSDMLERQQPRTLGYRYIPVYMKEGNISFLR